LLSCTAIVATGLPEQTSRPKFVDVAVVVTVDVCELVAVEVWVVAALELADDVAVLEPVVVTDDVAVVVCVVRSHAPKVPKSNASSTLFNAVAALEHVALCKN
jgi:hypothetical protein